MLMVELSSGLTLTQRYDKVMLSVIKVKFWRRI